MHGRYRAQRAGEPGMQVRPSIRGRSSCWRFPFTQRPCNILAALSNDIPVPSAFDMNDLFSTNAPAETEVLTVSAFTRRGKALLESGVRPGWVRGEVSNLRAQTSGHVYFSLKDAGAQLACVLFRGDAARQGVALRDGAQVVVFGELNFYEARGQYQLVVRIDRKSVV